MFWGAITAGFMAYRAFAGSASSSDVGLRPKGVEYESVSRDLKFEETVVLATSGIV